MCEGRKFFGRGGGGAMAEQGAQGEIRLADDLSEAAKRHVVSLYDENPFLAFIGARVMDACRGKVCMEAEVRHDFTNVYGVAHGAIAMALADTAMGGACFSCDRRVMTLDMGMNFLRPLPEGTRVSAVGEVVHSGRNTMVCEARVFDESGALCLKAQGTFFVMEEAEECEASERKDERFANR